jgi:hypothetical protein
MSDRQDLLDAADAAKLHAEINQLRNQEFLISSYGLVYVTAIISVSFQSSLGMSSITFALLTISLLAVLTILFIWYYTLSSLRTKISVYLAVTHLSKWEVDYRFFADKVTSPSQRTVSTFFFALLGALGTVGLVVRFFDNGSPINSPALLIAIFVILLAYLAFVSVLGLRSYVMHRYHFTGQWQRAFEERDKATSA